VLWASSPAGARQFEHSPQVTARSAAEALQVLLDSNIHPAGPLRADGATIAGVLVGQSLTFPIASSAGAYVSKELKSFAFGEQPLMVSRSGNFGSLFVERAQTNGRGHLSVTTTYQYKVWKTIAGVPLRGYRLASRAVYRVDVPDEGPLGTADDFEADIHYRTDVFVVAANYGLRDWLDVGVSVPFVSSEVSGTKRRITSRPQQTPELRYLQTVTGVSRGFSDLLLRAKGGLSLLRNQLGAQQPSMLRENDGGINRAPRGPLLENFDVAAGYDLRLPTGKTATLYLDCGVPDCTQGNTQEVPDLGLGKVTHRLVGMLSADLRRVSVYFNAGHTWVPSYPCRREFSETERCKGAIFNTDPVNNQPDAKGQDLSDEWLVSAGSSIQVIPYRATLSLDIIGRRMIDAGEFYQGPSRLIFRDDGPDLSVSTNLESRPGHVDTLVGALGAKVGFGRRWLFVTSVIFPLNRQGLQPEPALVLGLERAVGRGR
jgi:hypothetical protein